MTIPAFTEQELKELKNKLNSFATDEDFNIKFNTENKRKYLLKFFSYLCDVDADYLCQHHVHKNNNLIQYHLYILLNLLLFL